MPPAIAEKRRGGVSGTPLSWTDSREQAQAALFGRDHDTKSRAAHSARGGRQRTRASCHCLLAHSTLSCTLSCSVITTACSHRQRNLSSGPGLSTQSAPHEPPCRSRPTSGGAGALSGQTVEQVRAQRAGGTLTERETSTLRRRMLEAAAAASHLRQRANHAASIHSASTRQTLRHCQHRHQVL